MSNLEREYHTYLREKQRLLDNGYSGKHALIVGDKVESIWDTYQDALQAGYGKSLSGFMVHQILERDPVATLRTWRDVSEVALDQKIVGKNMNEAKEWVSDRLEEECASRIATANLAAGPRAEKHKAYAQQAVMEWDGQDDLYLIVLLYEKIRTPFWRTLAEHCDRIE